MTIEEKLRAMMYERGMWEQDIETVMQRYKSLDYNKSMAGRWDEPTENYPPQLMAALWYGLASETIKWIDENKPKAWFRAMFDTSDGVAERE